MRTLRTGLGLALIAGTLTLAATPASAAAGKIVYDSGSHIWIMDENGTNKVDLMATGWTGIAASPTLSPDGSTVAFAWTSGPTAGNEIFSMPAAPTPKTGATQLTTNTVYDSSPQYSPDGTKIAFVRDVPNGAMVPRNYEICTMDANGANPHRVTSDATGAYDFDPTWSPDGTKIAYASAVDGYGCYDEGSMLFLGFNQIYVAPAAGGGATDLIGNTSQDAASPDWSPDGNTIVFYGTRWTLGADTGNGPTCANDNGGNKVFTMPATGSANPTAIHAGQWPAWSPDGTKIVFDDAGQALTIMDANGANAASLSTTGRFPEWVLPSATAVPTTTTLTVTSTATNLKATGSVTPKVTGTVTVVLSRKVNGVFKKVASTTPTITASSTFATSFARPKPGTCRIKASYAGDATHQASSKSKIVNC
jgi:Tol biopolymer transport system component